MNKVIVIVGATASGKTGLAVRLAKRWNGEVISADSRAIYRGMDIGTAKPSAEEHGGVRHFGLDLVAPDERFTAADFQEYAKKKIEEIRARDKQPFVVGGTGLYVDALVYDYQFNNVVKNTCSDREVMNTDFIMVGIKWERDELRARIEQRANTIFEQPITEETKRLVGKYGWGSQAMKSNIYPIVWRMMQGEITEEEARRLFVLDDWHLAKRQLTWFKRNPHIHWFSLSEIEHFVNNLFEKL
ncbi:MAG: tRNA (adenosine(37)-N6)-dimethylallyltransferase MiaA [Candidatus Nomurabacteria bacterium]|jgi:tRNA dimethylallyltransferase|nr:tRNA (adenosine(37)-N6)-dimethylallyltransferase MiaA [Candidatus Nomurabacteria bacterium]